MATHASTRTSKSAFHRKWIEPSFFPLAFLARLYCGVLRQTTWSWINPFENTPNQISRTSYHLAIIGLPCFIYHSRSSLVVPRLFLGSPVICIRKHLSRFLYAWDRTGKSIKPRPVKKLINSPAYRIRPRLLRQSIEHDQQPESQR